MIAPGARAAPSFWTGYVLGAPLPLLVELGNDRWAGGAALPGFIGTFTIRKSVVVSLIYRPLNQPFVARDTEAAVAELRVGALTPDAAFDRAARLREGKEEDPVRGVLAAYLYDAQSDVESIRRTAYFLARANIPVPFDIAMLGRLPARQTTPARPHCG
jgi:hypothetical protein